MRNAVLAIFGLSAVLAGPASATDIFTGDKSLKDDANYASGAVTNHSGFYITGTLGIATGDRSIRRDVNRGVDANLDVTGVDPADVSDAQADLAAAGIPSSLNGNTLTIPLVGDHLGISDEDDFKSLVLGGGISYLYRLPSSRVGFSLGLEGTFYNDGESKSGHTDAAGTFTGGTALADINTGGFSCANINTCAGQPAQLGGVALNQTGVLTFDRDFDIDVPLKVHFFLNERLALNLGAGPSWSRGSAKGANGPTDPITAAIDGALPGFNKGLSTRFNEDDTSLGYLVTIGAQYWVTNNIVLGVQGDYKQHTFEFDAASGANVPVGGPLSIGSHSHDRTKVEDDVFSVKGTIGIKLN